MTKNQGGGLSPEQFNKLATKDDLDALEEKLEEKLASKEDINKVITILDSIVKKHKDFDDESIDNQDAHNRMQKEINETRTKVGLKVKSVV